MSVVFKREVSLLCSSTQTTGKLKLSREPNVIYVGRKPPMSYVMGIITAFSGSNAEKVTLKARGQSISTAVDAAEIVRHRFLRDLSVGNITLGTEEMPPREGESRPMNVSTIEITLTKETKPKEEAKAIQKAQTAEEKVA
jgi:DNA-binding protein Alba